MVELQLSVLWDQPQRRGQARPVEMCGTNYQPSTTDLPQNTISLSVKVRVVLVKVTVSTIYPSFPYPSVSYHTTHTILPHCHTAKDHRVPKQVTEVRWGTQRTIPENIHHTNIWMDRQKTEKQTGDNGIKGIMGWCPPVLLICVIWWPSFTFCPHAQACSNQNWIDCKNNMFFPNEPATMLASSWPLIWSCSQGHMESLGTCVAWQHSTGSQGKRMNLTCAACEQL